MHPHRQVLIWVLGGLVLGLAAVSPSFAGSRFIIPLSPLPPSRLPEEIPTFTVPVKIPRSDRTSPGHWDPTKKPDRKAIKQQMDLTLPTFTSSFQTAPAKALPAAPP